VAERVSRRHHPLATAIGLVAGLMTVAIAVTAAAESTVAPDIATARSVLTPQGVCGLTDGATVSLSAAAKASSYNVLVPTDSADTGSLAAVHSCPGTELILEFSSGAKIYLNNNQIKDPSAAWQAMAEGSVDTSVGVILGQPAALIDPAAAHANGSVTFVIDGTWVVVEGNGKLALADLEQIASSVKPFSALSSA
jgi:hypothetical protein